jgi:prepilin-type N-terminal cleavage/methylation domain-containing protein
MKIALQPPLDRQGGFNLIEISVVLIMAGMMAALTAPSILGMYWRTEADQAFNQVQGAFKQAQVQAIRMSRNCTLTIDPSEITAAPAGCLPETVEMPDYVTIDNGGTADITFGIRGETNLADNLIVTVSSSYDDSLSRCISISRLIGLMRTGVKEGDACVPN